MFPLLFLPSTFCSDSKLHSHTHGKQEQVNQKVENEINNQNWKRTDSSLNVKLNGPNQTFYCCAVVRTSSTESYQSFL